MLLSDVDDPRTPKAAEKSSCDIPDLGLASFKWKARQNVSYCQILPAQKLAPIWRGLSADPLGMYGEP